MSREGVLRTVRRVRAAFWELAWKGIEFRMVRGRARGWDGWSVPLPERVPVRGEGALAMAEQEVVAVLVVH